MHTYFILRGTIVHTLEYGNVAVLPDHVLVIDKQAGTIHRMCPASELDQVLSEISETHEHVLELKYQFTGTATDVPLMEWLDKYTFAAEGRVADLGLALDCYEKLVKRMLNNGTTCVALYSSLHVEPTKVLVDVLNDLGQRAIVGKVCMDRCAPEGYCESTAQNLAGAEEVIQYIRSKRCSRIYPCVTPRFIPTCTPDLMKGLAALAVKHGAYVQSHISESADEVAFTESLHPGCGGDCQMFDEMGLLTNKALMAHGTFLSDPELRIMAARGAALAHCPLSNLFFGDRLLRVNHVLSMDVHVGLGTDVAGGYSPSMLSAMRNAVLNSRAIRAVDFMAPQQPVNPATKQAAGSAAPGAAARASTPPEAPAAPGASRTSLASEPAIAPETPGPSSASESPAAPGAPATSHPQAAPGAAVGSLVQEASAAPEAPGVSGKRHPDVISWKEAFWLATTGGATALGLQDVIGSFRQGKEFDAILVSSRGGPYDIFPTDSMEDRVEKFFNLGDDRNIRRVFVQGREVVVSTKT